MKDQLKTHIQLLTSCDYNTQLDFDKFMNQTQLILNEFECKFRYLRSDSRRNGHISAKVNRRTGEYSLELAINRNDNVGGKVYTIFHELTHLINNHLFGKELTRKQSEVVADTVAIYFLNKYNLYIEYTKSHVASKWDVKNYSNVYIDSMGLSKERYKLIVKQINDSKIYLEKLFLN